MGSGQRKEMLRAAADDFWDMILLNIVYVFTCLPVITYGAATGALYSTVSRLGEKRMHGGALRMYWGLLRKSFGRASLLWCAVLAVAGLSAFDLAVIARMPTVVRYCSYGLQFFVLLLLQAVVTLGFPIASEAGLQFKDTVRKSFEALGRFPLRTLSACLIQLLPLAVLCLAPKAFAGLFLLWITVYFSFSERLIAAIIKNAVCGGEA